MGRLRNLKDTPSTPLTLRMQGEIEAMIMNGELNAGDRVTENLLAERFGVSRGPVREACRALTQEGLLTAIPNRGMFVREIALREALEVYDIRAALDDLVGREVAQHITTAEFAELARLVDEMDAAARRADLDSYYPLNLTYHDKLLDLAGNQRLSLLYRSLVKHLHLFRRKGLLSEGSMLVSNEEHRLVVAALERRDPVRAGLAMRAHVLSAKQRLIAAAAAEYAAEEAKNIVSRPKRQLQNGGRRPLAL
ncbi:MAG: FCD domain-containing protein [Hyphomicrobiales bacterium]|nr:FCD domain-containing protein [Hyphomicrobiales bacterium]